MRRVSNNTLLYIVAILVVIIVFMLMGGSQWARGMMHQNSSMSFNNLNWIQILIGIGIGFVLGLLYSRRKW